MMRLLLWIMLFLLTGCSWFIPDTPAPPKQGAASFMADEVIKSGDFEERVEYQTIPVNNCTNRGSVAQTIERQRTLEQSVSIDVTAGGGISGGANAGLTADLTLAVGAAYGVQRGVSVTDGGSLQFTVDPGEFPTYHIAWKETWEKGYVLGRKEGQADKTAYDYWYLKSAQPELINTTYTDCDALPTATPVPPTNTPVPPTNTPIPPTNTPRPPTNTPAPTANRQASSDNMVRVPAGEFTMGSDADVGFAECEAFYNDCKREWFEDEEPEHPVYVAEFYIDKYEVTNEQYRACVEAGDCDVPSNTTAYNDGGKANHPVVYVTWQMSRDYCAWAGKRLPTEAEWEKAARGTDGRVYPWGNEFDGSKVNFCDENCSRDWKLTRYDDGYVETSPVGSYELGKSPYGAYDMSGNVWEWTLSAYESYPYDKDDGRNDTNKNVSRVLRGGSWDDSTDLVRTADRLRGNPADTYSYFGFRCLRSP